MPIYAYGNSDHAASDDIDSILEYLRQSDQATQSSSNLLGKLDYELNERSPSPGFEVVEASSSKRRSRSTAERNVTVAVTNEKENENQEFSFHDHPSVQLRSKIEQLDAEVVGCREDISALQSRIGECLKEKAKLEKELSVVAARNRTGGSGSSTVQQNAMDPKGKGRALHQGGVNYMTETFDWTIGLKARMKSVFNIREFRLCQEGVCNANMDGRDIICIMPTGGGKSLTYQLPALLLTGCTLVISPLISLMTDQILHLREAKIEAVMLTSATKDSEKKQTIERLRALGERRPSGNEIKLIYVTPEKMSKDKFFRTLLQNVDAAKKLARIVIDEAHCVSQLGHDFRTDYKELHLLRKIFPSVPIMALSATCGARVMKDLISILGLRDTVSGTNAPPQGTILFTSPLYRKNLHYRVIPKPESSKEHLELMKTYILENHANETGIIYCLSKKDTETVAEQLREQSEGRIKTGVYHADVNPGTKERLHAAWREGKIKVVCATIAFGMGIDKGDVRFVLHHSISKSLEGFYQESGRAGRDGNDADCILYYRPQDASTMAATAARDTEGEEKLHAVLDFAEDLSTCRKVQFAEYFSHSSQLSVSSWSTSETGALDRCGHCDNCTRPADSTESLNCTLAAWQLLKIVQSVRQHGGKLTLTQLAALARGGAKGAYEVSTKKGRRQEKETFQIDLAAVAGGSVDLSKTDIEHLIVRLLTKRFFTEDYQQSPYSMNVYVAPGQAAARLNHQTRQTVEAGSASVKYQFDFVRAGAKAKKSKAAKSKTTGGQSSKTTLPAKRKALTIDSDLDDSPDDMYDSDTVDGGRATFTVPNIDDDSDEGEVMDWSYTMRDNPKPKSQPLPPPPKKIRKTTGPQSTGTNRKTKPGIKMNIIQEGDNEVVVLSSD